MKKVAIAVMGSVIILVMGASSAQAQFETPSKVKAWGVYQHYVEPGWPDFFPSDDEEGLFTLSVNPEAKRGKKAPQVVVWAVGRELRRFWGGPLLIRGDFDEWYPMVFDPSDPKPAQIFLFKMKHRVHGKVAVCVSANDNSTPGYNEELPLMSDWFGFWMEPLNGNRLPDGNPEAVDDDLFTGMGIVIHGDVIDYRQ